MALAKSRLTSQGQISVPVEVRRRLGISPGSVIEWDEQAGDVVVRRAAAASFEDIHKMLFPSGPPPTASVEEMNEAIRAHVGKKFGPRR